MRMANRFTEKVYVMVAELKALSVNNEAFAENIFPARLGKLIAEMNAQIVTSPRQNVKGEIFEYARLSFPDGSTTNMPTKRLLTKEVQRNSWTEEIRQSVEQAQQQQAEQATSHGEDETPRPASS